LGEGEGVFSTINALLKWDDRAVGKYVKVKLTAPTNYRVSPLKGSRDLYLKSAGGDKPINFGG